ncbi:acyl-CoA dehydrogenase family protein [Streptomyces resistomycificus]|uniref:Acyl-CoA dehydrogenase n=1 Tax=Streptomyces resistomycificus TaxID=67356 RepID=A0A0L8LGM2_9ACTN|nr:acyl-CoA dehydrogenase family protein [Streptomyces resistomycificus]KOG37254.1 acyl-CoA dehydrogenase [Streptomyces resistomycificus]KUN95213.1 acyl-CoA dehydrogenase [Streptomyces resistomycificus]
MIRHFSELDIRDRFAALAADTVAKRAEACTKEGRLDRESWQEMSNAGVWRLAVPSKWGGDDGTWWDFVAAFEGIATGGRDLGFCLSMVAQAGLIRSLITYGTDEQRAYWLPRLLNGEVGATALTETTGGSDVTRIRTAATSHGDHYVLTGHKDHITNGPVADVALILGRVPEHGDRDITLFMVDLHAEGIQQGPVEDMMGNQTSPTGPILLDQVVVDAKNIIGGVGGGLEAVYNTISLDRLLYGILAAAYLDPLLDEVLAYTEQRHAFNVPIAEHQYVQGRVTDAKFAIEATRWVSYGALDSLLQGSAQASMMCSVAKYHAAETLKLGTETALRVFGHLGYMEGPYTKALKDALGTVIAGGTAEMQRKNVFNQMRRLAVPAAA